MIDGFFFTNGFRWGKIEEEMEKKRGEGEEGDLVQPVEDAVQEVELPGRGKDVETIEEGREQIVIDVGQGERPGRVEEDDEGDDEGHDPDQGEVEVDQVDALLAELERSGS